MGRQEAARGPAPQVKGITGLRVGTVSDLQSGQASHLGDCTAGIVCFSKHAQRGRQTSAVSSAVREG